MEKVVAGVVRGVSVVDNVVGTGTVVDEMKFPVVSVGEKDENADNSGDEDVGSVDNTVGECTEGTIVVAGVGEMDENDTGSDDDNDRTGDSTVGECAEDTIVIVGVGEMDEVSLEKP